MGSPRSNLNTYLSLMAWMLLLPSIASAQVEGDAPAVEQHWEEAVFEIDEWEEDIQIPLEDPTEVTNNQAQGPEITTAEDGANSEEIHPLANTQENWKNVIGDTRFEDGDKELEQEEKPTEKPKPNVDILPPNLLKAIVILTIVTLLILIIIRFSKSNLTVNKKVDELNIEMVEDAERNIQESDLERLLRLALEGRDYRMALRVRYLMILKELDAHGWIEHRPEKTNNNYLMEISGRPESKRFADLTNIFEYVWYAEIHIPEKDDALFAREFGGFLTDIARTREE